MPVRRRPGADLEDPAGVPLGDQRGAVGQEGDAPRHPQPLRQHGGDDLLARRRRRWRVADGVGKVRRLAGRVRARVRRRLHPAVASSSAAQDAASAARRRPVRGYGGRALTRPSLARRLTVRVRRMPPAPRGGGRRPAQPTGAASRAMSSSRRCAAASRGRRARRAGAWPCRRAGRPVRPCPRRSCGPAVRSGRRCRAAGCRPRRAQARWLVRRPAGPGRAAAPGGASSTSTGRRRGSAAGAGCPALHQVTA